MSRAGLVGFALIAAVVGYVVVGSLNIDAHSCEICMSYQGRSQCRTVNAATIEEARQGAITNACAFISGGVTDTMACGRSQPTSERCQ
ncbi:MAG TPA: hypothetical protein VEL28_05465 [Candidatus Binatia bacterium]|nr:hypothetical protein [Candidatus Binatia bacterium]